VIAFDSSVVVVISGPGGVGKGTMVDVLMERNDGLWLSRSCTTRERRPGESESAYHFISEEEFQARIDSGGFLEWVQFLDYRQGTPVPNPPEGHDIVFEIDVYGAREAAARYNDALLLFIDAPSPEEQQRRLRGRGDHDEKVAARLAKAAEERAVAAELGMITIVNDDLLRAVEEVERLVGQHRSRRWS